MSALYAFADLALLVERFVIAAERASKAVASYYTQRAQRDSVLDERIKTMSKTMDELRVEVSRDTSVMTGAATLINALADKLDAAIKAKDAGEDTALTELAAELRGSADPLAEAIARNTVADASTASATPAPTNG